VKKRERSCVAKFGLQLGISFRQSRKIRLKVLWSRIPLRTSAAKKGLCIAKIVRDSLEEFQARARDVFSKLAIGLPLRLIIELVPCRFVRKGLVADAVLIDIIRLIASQAGLEVQQQPDISSLDIVVNRSHDHVLLRATVGTRLQGFQIDLDLHTEVFANPADRIAKIVKRHIRVGSSIRDNDVPAMTSDEFVDGGVFKMASV
jgi:hypothetical protein